MADARGVVPLDKVGRVAVANANAGGKGQQVAKAVDPKNANVIAKLAGPEANGKGKPLNVQEIDPRLWDQALAEGNIEGSALIATAELLFEQPDKKHVVEFLKANLRRGLLVRPWVYEALAVALEASGGDPEEVRRARLSAIALDPTDAAGFLQAARDMASNNQFDRALAFCRQAALLEPNLVHCYDEALAYAERDKDVKSMEWAASRLLSQDWPVDNPLMHLKAQTRVTALAQTLEREQRVPDADRLRSALQVLKRRDLVIHLSWESSPEPADLELIVKEPTGSLCSYDQKQTAGGGMLLTGDLKNGNKVSYVAAEAFPGPTGFTVRRP